MKLKSLKLDPAEAKKEIGPMPDKPRFPYGTCLYLDQVALEKLGIDVAVKAGTKFNIVAVGIVTGSSSRQSIDGEAYNSVDIQLTDMGLSQQSKAKDLASSMYPDMGDGGESAGEG